VTLNITAVMVLTIHRTRQRRTLLNLACGMAIVGVWIEKGMGLIVPGFIPTPIGEMFDYVPTAVEIGVSIAIWATGLLVFTVLAKVAIPIELGTLTYRGGAPGRAAPGGGRTTHGTSAHRGAAHQ
jgi:molybdopterin-containing oxidoreductase family membrane subunit